MNKRTYAKFRYMLPYPSLNRLNSDGEEAQYFVKRQYCAILMLIKKIAEVLTQLGVESHSTTEEKLTYHIVTAHSGRGQSTRYENAGTSLHKRVTGAEKLPFTFYIKDIRGF